jgi:ribosomal protein L11 methyltransferase
MLITTFTAPKSLADTLLILTDTHPEISLDVGEHPTDGSAFRYTLFLPEQLKPIVTANLANHGILVLGFSTVNESIDYVALTRANFPPLVIGPYFIARNEEAPPPEKIGLRISPNRAFGSGEHATTTGCLLGYEYLLEQGVKAKNVLDFGCGSGILALASAKREGLPALCIDNDPPSIDICEENAALNGVKHLLTCQIGETPPKGQIFDLVFANILLQPLLELAQPLANCTAQGGALILSGFTTEQAPEIEARYSTLGLRHTWRHDQSGWVAQIWQRD